MQTKENMVFAVHFESEQAIVLPQEEDDDDLMEIHS
jgi:hypothetical protein